MHHLWPELDQIEMCLQDFEEHFKEIERAMKQDFMPSSTVYQEIGKLRKSVQIMKRHLEGVNVRMEHETKETVIEPHVPAFATEKPASLEPPKPQQ